jgi:hypothetical protein
VRAAHAHSAGSARVLGSPGASRRGRRRCYSGRCGANGGTRAPTAERLPTGHGGGGDSSPELLVDGEGEKNRIDGGVLRRGEGSGGRQRSCDGETKGELAAARRRQRRSVARLTWHGAAGNDGVSAALELQWGGFGQQGGSFRPGERAVGTARARQGDGTDSGARSGGLLGCWCVVPTAPLRHASNAGVW